MNARIPNEENIIIGIRYPPVALRTMPMSSGTRHKPMFCTQNIRQ